MNLHNAIISKLHFDRPQYLSVCLLDGREIAVPLEYFPLIQALSLEEREHWQLLDEQVFSFEVCDEVFHLSELLGIKPITALPALEYA